MSRILSVGIDIGTTTTQVIFSNITIDNTASYFTVPHISIVDKEIIYKSPLFLTPLRRQFSIDADALRDIVAGEFAKAGFESSQVDTGAVIITGEAARKENSKAVLEALSDFAGDFVVSTAGPDLESVIAGKGSGAYQYSIDNHCPVVNLDVGGGTTNLAFFDDGKVVGKSCFDIGGRLIRLDRDGTVRYVAPSAQTIADSIGARISIGSHADIGDLSKVTDAMADILVQAAGLEKFSTLADKVRTKASSAYIPCAAASKICFSGGVADCMKNRETDAFAFGDVGVLLGASIKRKFASCRAEIVEARETIRATVIGAGTCTMNLSGSTICCSDGIFPVKNVPVCKLPAEVEKACFDGISEPLADFLGWFVAQSAPAQIAIAMKGLQNPEFDALERAAECLVKCADGALNPELPLIVILEEDIAKAFGIAIRVASGGMRKVASIDGVCVEDGDYLDIGSPLMDGLVVPVVVKTLLFG